MMKIEKLANCARCGFDHDKPITFKMLKRPMGDFTHWAPCPNNGDPIILKIEDIIQK